MRSNNSMKAATTACMPRLVRGSCRASTARPAASVSLLERIRDVVLRLIMLSAVSKASVKRTGSASKASSSPRAAPPVACRRDDSIRNEAVEDCIEFLKRSSAEGDAAKLSSVTAAETASVARDLVTKPSSPSTVITTDDAVTAHGAPAKQPSIGQHLAASSPASPVTAGAVEVGMHCSTSQATITSSPRLV
uniref:Uncharacterized protein n=1 Tax=Oryza punctata TaxID=4537 RepID=A0A0E0M5Y7_ORYPU